MSHPLEQRWAETRRCLNDAYSILRRVRWDDEAKRCFLEYEDSLDHNELELALDALEQLTVSFDPAPEVWDSLAVVAESMDLMKRATRLRGKKKVEP